jgi:DinB superfamily
VDPQLNAVIGDLRSAEQRLRTLHAILPGDAWGRRPGLTRWSPAECVAHLNLTSDALLPLLHAGLEQAVDGPGRAASRYRRDLVGWLLWRVMAPSGGLRTRTIPALVPSVESAREAIIADFERLQSELISCVRAADGLAVDRIKMASPFDARVRYNLYAALTLVPRHQHRHLLQAERAADLVTSEQSALAV